MDVEKGRVGSKEGKGEKGTIGEEWRLKWINVLYAPPPKDSTVYPMLMSTAGPRESLGGAMYWVELVPVLSERAAVPSRPLLPGHEHEWEEELVALWRTVYALVVVMAARSRLRTARRVARRGNMVMRIG